MLSLEIRDTCNFCHFVELIFEMLNLKKNTSLFINLLGT